jgi:hypothetical protein
MKRPGKNLKQAIKEMEQANQALNLFIEMNRKINELDKKYGWGEGKKPKSLSVSPY